LNASQSCLRQVCTADCCSGRNSFDTVRDRVAPVKPVVPVISIPPPDLAAYDRLLASGGAA
jgi:hypothetical protein